MSGQKKNYTGEFKKKAVELSYLHGSDVEICTELDIPATLLSQWLKEFNTYVRIVSRQGHLKLTDKKKK